jgi:ribosomal protein S19
VKRRLIIVPFVVGDVLRIGKGDVSFFRFYIEEKNFGAGLSEAINER